MSRGIKKSPFVDGHLLKKVAAQENAEKKQVIKTWFRCSAIFPSFVSLTIAVCDGRKHIPTYVTEDMVSHKLSESVPTRTFRGHKVDDRATRQLRGRRKSK